MVGSLIAVVLALVITGAPVVTTLCLAVCATRSVDTVRAGQHEHHSCHTATPSNQVGIDGVAHRCDHSDGHDQIGGGQTTNVSALFTAAIDHLPLVPAVLDETGPVVSRDLTHSPPGSLARTSQLRI